MRLEPGTPSEVIVLYEIVGTPVARGLQLIFSWSRHGAHLRRWLGRARIRQLSRLLVLWLLSQRRVLERAVSERVVRGAGLFFGHARDSLIL